MHNRPTSRASAVPGQTPPSTLGRSIATCAAWFVLAGAGCVPPSPRECQDHNRPGATPDHAAGSAASQPARMPPDAQAHAGRSARFHFQKSPQERDLLPPLRPAMLPSPRSTAFAGSSPPLPWLPGQATPTDCTAAWPASSSQDRAPCAHTAFGPCASLFH